MSTVNRLLLAGFLMTGTPAFAEAPRVAADILPVHGLVARVMQGVGTPDLLLPPSASPHGHAMRPSEAMALERAHIVFWVGAELTPWLEAPLRTLAGDARIVALLDAPGAHRLPFRDPDQGGDHGRASHTHHGHDHGEIDPHAWLDPDNGVAWLDVIAETLATVDPANAERYRSNAAAASAEISAVAADLEARLAKLHDKPFVTYHDATQYFEDHFGLHFAGALSLGDGAAPGPAQVAEIRARLVDLGAECFLAEPLANTKLAVAVLEGTGARLVVLDPLGTSVPVGPSFYPELLRALGDAFESCG